MGGDLHGFKSRVCYRGRFRIDSGIGFRVLSNFNMFRFRAVGFRIRVGANQICLGNGCGG